MSNLGIGYHYSPFNYIDTNSSANNSPLTRTPKHGSTFNPNSYAPYAQNGNSGTWYGKAWNATKPFLPQSYAEVGSLLSGVGSIWGAIAGAKAAKDANQTAKDNLDEIKKRNKKIDDDNEALVKSINSVWDRE
ncbi:hypothetical protein BKH42_04125 [Helicobacter sp. 13S00482-2]|uniref:hypothetical protein n=1 Tax=Helicobacter sp. 13S00482-2 TaxID=1476200 RepID=UPI000BDA4282|nr:hypothetical protein [Helicobacter sp. 13S00482-2]PAF53692.1 hypothetical protein BKH42_04125 [Helicobacter sp. 13S00482-2]